jgi:DNA end-binding protein Ku
MGSALASEAAMARTGANDRETPARPIWKGTLSFGLVNVPVRVHIACARKGVHFREVHDEDGGRIKLQPVCARDGAVVRREHIAMRFDLEPGRHVLFTPAEIRALGAGASRAIEVDAFVDPARIDPIFYDRSYYLTPDEGGARGYALLAAAMEARRLVAIARLTLRGRPRVGVVRPLDAALAKGRTVLALSLLDYAEEILPAADLAGLPGPEAQPGERELAAAERLIDARAERFAPERYHDHHRDEVLAFLRRRAEGGEAGPAAVEAPGPAADLLDALEASLAEAERHRTAA